MDVRRAAMQRAPNGGRSGAGKRECKYEEGLWAAEWQVVCGAFGAAGGVSEGVTIDMRVGVS